MNPSDVIFFQDHWDSIVETLNDIPRFLQGLDVANFADKEFTREDIVAVSSDRKFCPVYVQQAAFDAATGIRTAIIQGFYVADIEEGVFRRRFFDPAGKTQLVPTPAWLIVSV